MTQPEDDPAFAQIFDPETGGSEREYLHYINGKLRYTNTLLEKLYWALTGVGILVAVGVVVLIWSAGQH